MTNRSSDGDAAQRVPLWRIVTPLIAGLAIALVGTTYYYFGPRLADVAGDTPRPSAREDVNRMRIGDRAFAIPENFTVYPRDRASGARAAVHLYAALPDFEGYGDAPRRIFAGVDASTALVRWRLFETAAPMDERALFEIALKPILQPEATDDAPGLMRFTLLADVDERRAALADQDVFAGETENGEFVVLRCDRARPGRPEPICTRQTRWSDAVGLGYRFHRNRLADWARVEAGVRDLAARFDVGAIQDLRDDVN